MQVHGLLGSSRDRAAARAEQLGIGTAYGSLDELLADDRVDVVHITSPNREHHPQVRAILAAGRHVVRAKPLAATSAESAELVALAEASDRLSAGLQHPLLPDQPAPAPGDRRRRHRRRAARHRALLQDWLLLDTDWNRRLEPRSAASCARRDIGSHWLDLTS